MKCRGTILSYYLPSGAVEDVNDNTPRFDSPVAQHDIIENTNLVMIPVPATDPDAGDNGRITYEIIGGNINDTFAIAG